MDPKKIFDELWLKSFVIISLIIGVGSFKDINESKIFNMSENNNQKENSNPRVTGIGGVFFFSENPKDTKNWYEEQLGLVTNDWGAAFEFRNANRPDEINYLQWSLFNKDSEYFKPSEKGFMINYRVQHIEALVEKLRSNGVTILDDIETYEYGKFVHILDPEGNKIELWEPVDSFLTQLGGPTTK